MLPSQKESSAKSVLESNIHRTSQRGVTAHRSAPWSDRVPAAEARASAQFPYRILFVDDESSLREIAEQVLKGEGYEVVTATNGVDGLHALSKSLPDVIISDLNMPQMSGREFLDIVRKRFPHIATIAISGQFTASEQQSDIRADAFLQKGQYTLRELFDKLVMLLNASPIRSETRKSELAPLFIPRDKAGYLLITCPQCLRPNKLEAMSLNGGLHQTNCQLCGTPVRFEINHEIQPSES